ncbi:MAG: rhodanese-like domain-containing protein [Leptospirillia bacterium]
MFGFISGRKELELHPTELKTRIDNGEDIVIIDVRENWEHSRVKLPDALHIPLAELPRKLSGIDKEKDVVVYCHHGTRSLQACHFLKKMGFERVKNLTGGIDAYALHVDKTLPRY